MNKQIWLSVVHWPKDNISLGNVDNASTDSHDSEEMAQSIVDSFSKKGFACEGKYFPVKAYVILKEDYDFTMLYRANQKQIEGEGWVINFDDEVLPELHSVQKDDFDADTETWSFIASQAEAGSELHQEAMLYLERNNPTHFSEIADIIQIDGTI